MASNFIKIGNVNLKRSNIKEFGIATKSVPDHKEGQSILSGFIKIFLFPKTVRYFFITTFQGENYTFEEHEINIDYAEKSLTEN